MLALLSSILHVVPPLSTEPHYVEMTLLLAQSISSNDVAAEFTALEELKRTREVQSIININKVQVLEKTLCFRVYLYVLL